MSDTDLTLPEALADLESAEDFLDHFGIPFDPAVVHVNRLHILQRFHDYLARSAQVARSHDDCRRWLEAAYADFVTSDARTEKVFRVFRRNEPQTVFVPLAEAFR